MSTRPSFCLFGASPTTANLGVSALHHATVAALLAREPEAQVTVFDHGRGERTVDFVTRGKTFQVRRLGAHHSRRYWRGDSLGTMRMLSRFGGFGNPGATAIRSADVVFDLSGGDSFTDLYGAKRFWGVTLPKLMALDCGARLVLPPQTYGPFADPEFKSVAASVVQRATSAWARDPRSLKVLHELNGGDDERLDLGVDVAFGLERQVPKEPLSLEVERWLSAGDGPVIGLNISGLVYLDPERGSRDYGFQADYRKAVLGLLMRLLHETDARIVLVPHVLEAPGHYESDPEASSALLAAAGNIAKGRVHLLAPDYTVTEIKELIGRLDWFCGTRMHATIAALSTGVPAAAIAYSPKFHGIFEVCDQADGVGDPTKLDTDPLVTRLFDAYQARDDARARLTAALPPILERVETQADRMASHLQSKAESA